MGYIHDSIEILLLRNGSFLLLDFLDDPSDCVIALTCGQFLASNCYMDFHDWIFVQQKCMQDICGYEICWRALDDWNIYPLCYMQYILHECVQ